MQHLEIRHELHPEDRGSRTYHPLASYTLSKDEKEIFSKQLFDLKVPDGYSSNIGNCISMDDLKVTSLIAHDCHVLMLQLLLVALKGLLPTGPRNAILRLCTFFNRLCQRVVDGEETASLEDEVVETLCMLERFFPPSFFDIMIQVKAHTNNELERLQWLANGPGKHVMSYTGYIINEQRFHTKEVEKSTQNSDVSIDATTLCRSSEKDNAQVVDVAPPRGFYDLEMYEEIVDISCRPQDVSALGMDNDDDDERITNIRGDCNDKKKDIGCIVNGNPDYEPCDGEGRVTSDSDNDDPSRSQANQVKGTGPRKKKGCSSAQLLKKSQRTQETGGSPQGATQAQQLPHHLLNKLTCFAVHIQLSAAWVRFNLYEEWHREMVFRRMNENWRASKSTLVRKARNASNEEERLKLQPDSIKLLQDWKDLVKKKTSDQFKVTSNKFKGLRQKQLELQHTMSCKGYARLTAELKDMERIEQDKPNSSSTNLKEDTRLTILSQMNGQFDELHEENVKLKSQMADMKQSTS
ncbi:hypothetical protein RHSIM_Rhsim04G0152600 [Rhododendron simsii]|uniref:DUF4218 domain-containing protein n=1 Tax=Rhododendron simsii TaxID=118357 RepID=A0A834H5E0_RHOSS|nr:hypothetical protein RHSIM_Rhsim04G0152600 [Rhododendron simsii]